MTLRKESRVQLVVSLGYVDTEGGPSDRAVANLLRAPLSRWGLSPKRAVLKYAREELRACGVENPSGVPRILQRLIDLGECEEVCVGHESYLAPTAPRWISVGDGVATFLGVSPLPDDLSVVEGNHRDIIRRVRVVKDEDAAALQFAGVREVSLAEWLVPPDYFRHASRRMRQPARSDALSLSNFWDLLEEALKSEGLILGADAEVRLLRGHPGEFFGRHDSLKPEGRWTRDTGEGVWCAYRRGYGDSHWHPCIIAVGSDHMRALDLYDQDEWRWAVLARGQRVGTEEVVRSGGGRVQLTFPPPNQLLAAMDILGTPSSAWAWDMSPNGPDLWGLLS